MSMKPSRTVRLNVEALPDRLVPSVGFSENTSTHTVIVTAGNNQNNSVAVRNDGRGNLEITGDGVTRNFTAVQRLYVYTGNGTDTVTYDQGTATREADTRRSFRMDVYLGDNLPGSNERFTANLFGDVGFSQGGVWRARHLTFNISGGGGPDRIDINAGQDVDIHPGSTLRLYLNGNDGDDTITVDTDGEVDGTIFLRAHGENGNDTVAVNLGLDAGSSGSVAGGRPDIHNGAAVVTGNLGDDNLTFAVRLAAGATAGVNAIVDGGFGLGWPDNDIGRHTANVRTAWLEQDVLIE